MFIHTYVRCLPQNTDFYISFYSGLDIFQFYPDLFDIPPVLLLCVLDITITVTFVYFYVRSIVSLLRNGFYSAILIPKRFILLLYIVSNFCSSFYCVIVTVLFNIYVYTIFVNCMRIRHCYLYICNEITLHKIYE